MDVLSLYLFVCLIDMIACLLCISLSQIAMDSTDGLTRGQKVVNTGSPIKVPVGRGTLGRILNVIGEPVDEQGPVSE